MIHGDLVFTNLMLTPSSNIVMFDIGGCLGSKMTVSPLDQARTQRLGLILSVLYVKGYANNDLAKVYQSLLGYDFWIHDVEINDSVELYLASLQDVFWAFVAERYPKSEPRDIKVELCHTVFRKYFYRTDSAECCQAVTASLLFSMVPLHERPDHRTRFLRECSRILEDDLKLIDHEDSQSRALSMS